MTDAELLLSRYLDGELSQEEHANFEAWLAADEANRQLYFDWMLEARFISDKLKSEASPYHDKALLIDADVSQPIHSKGSSSLLSRTLKHEWVVAIAAGVVFVVAMLSWMAITYLPEVVKEEEKPAEELKEAVHIAWLTGTHDVKWRDGERPLMVANRLDAGAKLAIDAGLVEVVYVSGAKLVIEGPAEYWVGTEAKGTKAQSESGNEKAESGNWDANSGYLALGKLVARCDSPGSKGFTVETPVSRVVDLGTEFGVSVVSERESKVIVYDGSVRVHWSGAPQTLTAGQMVSIDVSGRKELSRDAQPGEFARRMPLPLLLDLADIVGGGNGKGTGKRGHGIHPANGQLTPPTTLRHGPPIYADASTGNVRYHAVSLPMVDGVFIPAPGKLGEEVVEQQITSTGLRAKLPATDGNAWGFVAHNSHAPQGFTALGDVDYRASENTVLGMHASSAITFDLKAVRSTYPKFAVREFRAIVGDAHEKGETAQVTFLVDGAVVESLVLDEALRPNSISFDIEPKDRFLTIAVTDGGDTHSFDQVIMGNATLVLHESLNTEQRETGQGEDVDVVSSEETPFTE